MSQSPCSLVSTLIDRFAPLAADMSGQPRETQTGEKAQMRATATRLLRFIILLSATGTLLAQNAIVSGSLRGTISDSTRAVVPAALSSASPIAVPAANSSRTATDAETTCFPRSR